MVPLQLCCVCLVIYMCMTPSLPPLKVEEKKKTTEGLLVRIYYLHIKRRLEVLFFEF